RVLWSRVSKTIQLLILVHKSSRTVTEHNLNARVMAAFTPKWHVVRGMPRGTPVENEHPEIYETFHREVA
ncbi:hypothetical protein SK128_025502, partial [Halocaridina rubra]